MAIELNPAAAGTEAPCVTVGVVIDLPEPHATVVRRWRGRVGDPQAELIPPHVTLLPPTTVAADDLPDVAAHLAQAAAGLGPFAMSLTGTGTFRPMSQVVYVQVTGGLVQCEKLESAIRSGPLTRDLDFPFHPHVTVAHDVGPAALDAAFEGLGDFVGRFQVQRFALYRKAGPHVWMLDREFALAGD